MRVFSAITACSIAVAGLIVLVVTRNRPAGSHREAPQFQYPQQPSQPPPQLEQPPQLPPQPAQPKVKVVEIPGGTRTLRRRFTAEQLQLLEMLNRADLRHLGRLQEIVVPTDWTVGALAYSPLPESYPAAAQTPKLLVVDLADQVFGAYAYGQLVRWGPISSGRRDAPTPQGMFHLTWKAKLRYSSVDPDWPLPWCFNFSSRQGLDLHAYALPDARPVTPACACWRTMRNGCITGASNGKWRERAGVC